VSGDDEAEKFAAGMVRNNANYMVTQIRHWRC
jgi:hypothetical protein